MSAGVLVQRVVQKVAIIQLSSRCFWWMRCLRLYSDWVPAFGLRPWSDGKRWRGEWKTWVVGAPTPSQWRIQKFLKWERKAVYCLRRTLMKVHMRSSDHCNSIRSSRGVIHSESWLLNVNVYRNFGPEIPACNGDFQAFIARSSKLHSFLRPHFKTQFYTGGTTYWERKNGSQLGTPAPILNRPLSPVWDSEMRQRTSEQIASDSYNDGGGSR